MILTKMVYSSEQIDTNAYNYLKKSVVFKMPKKKYNGGGILDKKERESERESVCVCIKKGVCKKL